MLTWCPGVRSSQSADILRVLASLGRIVPPAQDDWSQSLGIIYLASLNFILGIILRTALHGDLIEPGLSLLCK